MQYFAAYRFIFWNPKWLIIILIGCLCMLIPVVGIIVFIGYLFEIIEFFHRRCEEEKVPTVQPADDAIQTGRGPMTDDAREAAYPDFDVNRLSDYLMRGLWPVLVNVVASLLILFALGIFFFVSLILIRVAADNNVGGLVIGITIGVMVVAYFALILVWSIVQVPIYLRAGLGRDFASAFSVRFFKDFLRRVGKELILAQLFLFAGSLVLTLAGLVACYFGLYPATVVMIMATHYMDFELYELYLERGGTAIVPVR
ncbi:hypothetical protein AYO40_00805 [Planctomycetaceae bacterium SCGC AG-212-D15]|nr:hypothetical protein AYO40_00805 [Planctomycetaceae bacterium SCGC AG-212-D15]